MDRQNQRRKRQLRARRRAAQRESEKEEKFDEEDFHDDEESYVSSNERYSQNPRSPEEQSEMSNDSSLKRGFFRDALFSTRFVDPKINNRHLKDVEGESLTEKYLSPDVYSLIYLCDIKSSTFLYCIFCVGFQFAIFMLSILNASNAMNDDSTANFFAVPIDVEVVVRISQLFALILLVASQDDFLYALAFFSDGYAEEIQQKAPYATLTKFYFAGFLKTMEGVLSCFITFILIVQSSTVISLFLNFAALSFVYCIDDVFFNLAGSFMFTDELGVLVSKVRTMTVPIPARVLDDKNTVSSFRIIHLSLTISVMVIFWGLISLRQIQGAHACQSILVQFGDGALAFLAMYSGAYDRLQNFGDDRYFVNKRFVYVRRDHEDAMFAYCASSKQWTLTINYQMGSYLELDPCNVNYTVATSAETKTFDILSTVSSPWMTINTQTFKPATLDYFTMICSECGDCNDRGKCVGNACVCDTGVFGLDCEFDSVCDNLTESLNHEFFRENNSESFRLYNNSEFSMFNRPVFYRENISEKYVDFIMFLGRRWGYFVLDHTDNAFENEDEFLANITETFSNVNSTSDVPWEFYPRYLSSPVSFGTSADTGTPLAESWFNTYRIALFVAADSSRPKNARLLCPTCADGINPCQYDGVCNTDTHTCDCPGIYTGILCEKPLVQLNA